jgi:pimeloyl-ACP methyl ester carboxylesterase
MEKFEILNEKEERLSGVIETDHPKKKQPVVIFLNGFLDTAETPAKRKVAALLRKDGFVTVLFDYTYGFGQGSGNIANFTLTNQVADTEKVVDYVRRRGYIDQNRIILLGHCFGGMAAILYSAFDAHSAAVIAISTPYDFEDTRVTRMDERERSRIKLKRYFHLFSDNLNQEVRIDYAFLEDGSRKDMARAVRNLKKPTLIVHGRRDASIPTNNAQEIFDRLPGPKELQIIEGMEHTIAERDLKELYPAMRAFLKKHLKA